MKFSVAVCGLAALALANVASAAFDMHLSFDLIDANKDEWISHAEFTGLFQTFDDDADGQINATEFVNHFMKTGMSLEGSLYIYYVVDENQNQLVNTTEVENFYKAIDIEGDGMLSHIEYSSSMNAFLSHLVIAAAGQPRLDALFDAADVDADGSLTADEFWSLLTPADLDGDQIITETEFVKYWRNKTLDTEDRAKRTFRILNAYDDTPGIGSDQEKQLLFTSFDYGNDGSVQKQEFQFSMLNIFSRVMVEVSLELYSEFQDTNVNRQNIFNMVDTNKDSKWSLEEVMASSNLSDTNRDGTISPEEYINGRISMGFSKGSALYTFFAQDLNDDNNIGNDDVKAAFQMNDQNRDNSISKDEFNRVLDFTNIDLHFASRAVPKIAAMIWPIDANGDEQLTLNELRTLTAAADPNGDGVIISDDFVDFWSTHTGLSKEFSGHMFEVFDPNGDGNSTATERLAVFASFDYDRSGTVSTEEFKSVMVYLYANIVRGMKMEIAMKFRGTFNHTALFVSTDTNKDGVLDEAEINANFGPADLDGDGMLNASEFSVGYVAAGLDARGALYIFFRVDEDRNQLVTKTEYDDLFTTLDLDADKRITMSEYNTVFSSILYELQEAAIAAKREMMLFDWFDKDKDGFLSYAELSGLFAYADTDKSGLVNEAEFKKFWMFETGEPADRTELVFADLDADNDGSFGNDQEGQLTFDAFDYTDDNLVSKDEFINSLLNVFAEAVEGLEAQRAGAAVVKFFF